MINCTECISALTRTSFITLSVSLPMSSIAYVMSVKSVSTPIL